MQLRREIHPGDISPGGSVSRLSTDIFREAAYIAYHFGWGRNEILEMSHKERKKWLAEISNINNQINFASRRRIEEKLNAQQ